MLYCSTEEINLRIFFTALLLYTGFALYLFFRSDGVLFWITQHKAESILGSMSEQKPWIEVTREFLGLLILMSALMLNLIFQKKKRIRTGSHNSES